MVELGHITDVDKARAVEQFPDERGRVDTEVPLPQPFGKCFRHGMDRHGAEALAVIEHQAPIGDAAQIMCLFQDRVEHRGEVAGRRIDHLQDLGGRGLLLQRLARLGQEPRILHRDYRLRREVL